MKNASPPDLAQRQQALEPGQSFIVQAPAGSGKTGLLVRRFLRLLATVDQPEEILAITFTRKATAEMRHRIMQALQGEANQADDLRQLVEQALQRDQANGWNIRQNPRRLRILTIDGLCSEIVRKMPWTTRFGSFPSISDNNDRLYQLAARQTLQHIDFEKSPWRKASQHLMQVVDGNFWMAEQLLSEMLRQRDKWLPILKGHSREDLESMWQTVCLQKIEKLNGLLDDHIKEELTLLARHAATRLSEQESKNLLEDWLQAEGLTLSVDSIKRWQGIAELMLKKDDGIRTRFTKLEGFETSDKEMKGRMGSVNSWLANNPVIHSALIEIRHLPNQSFSDQQWQSLAALSELLPVAVAELQLLFNQDLSADFSEIAQRAGAALGDSDNPTELSLAFDYSLKHILVDEFQDTSDSQVSLLEKLTMGWQQDDGRSLFLVGDPMQSIYLFRQAEVSNFLRVQNQGIGALKVIPLSLNTNFRSSSGLIDWFNGTFESVFPDQQDYQSGAVSYSPSVSVQTPQSEASVSLNCNFEPEAKAQHELVVEQVDDLLRQSPDVTIAILGRTRSHLVSIIDQLKLKNIPFQAIEQDRLDQTQHILDLRTLTLALLDSSDRAAWIGLMRTPWLGLTLTDMTLLVDNDFELDLIDTWNDPNRLSQLSSFGQSKISMLKDKLVSALEKVRRYEIRQTVESLWLTLGGAAHLTADQIDDCLNYFDMLSEMEKQDITINQASLTEHLARLWAAPGQHTRVQVMTIHKAKGLEFDHVFLPHLEGRGRNNSRELLRWFKLGDTFLMAPIPHSHNKEDKFYQYLGRLESNLQNQELGRLLYVACTRAKNHLHLFCDVRTRDDLPVAPTTSTFLGLLWPSLESEIHDQWENSVPTDVDHEISDDLKYHLPVIDLELHTPEFSKDIAIQVKEQIESSDIEFDWATETARITGIILHSELQNVDSIGWHEWQKHDQSQLSTNRWQARLMEFGLSENQALEASNRIGVAINQMKQDPRAEWIFSKDHNLIQTEWSVTGLIDGVITHAVIDRSFVDESGVRWIVDFKSGRHDQPDLGEFLDREQLRYQDKMADYARIVKELDGAESQIKLGLYFPLLGGWREWWFN